MKENSKTMFSMDMGFIKQMMVMRLRVIGLMDKFKGKVKLPIPIHQFIMEN